MRLGVKLGEILARYQAEGLQKIEYVVVGGDLVGFYDFMGSLFTPHTEP